MLWWHAHCICRTRRGPRNRSSIVGHSGAVGMAGSEDQVPQEVRQVVYYSAEDFVFSFSLVYPKDQ